MCNAHLLKSGSKKREGWVDGCDIRIIRVSYVWLKAGLVSLFYSLVYFSLLYKGHVSVHQHSAHVLPCVLTNAPITFDASLSISSDDHVHAGTGAGGWPVGEGQRNHSGRG
ncbi:unnamed protein product [Scytosiphon promiscuus]